MSIKILVFWSTGKTGLEVIIQSLEKGYEVAVAVANISMILSWFLSVISRYLLADRKHRGHMRCRPSYFIISSGNL